MPFMPLYLGAARAAAADRIRRFRQSGIAPSMKPGMLESAAIGNTRQMFNQAVEGYRQNGLRGIGQRWTAPSTTTGTFTNKVPDIKESEGFLREYFWPTRHRMQDEALRTHQFKDTAGKATALTSAAMFPAYSTYQYNSIPDELKGSYVGENVASGLADPFTWNMGWGGMMLGNQAASSAGAQLGHWLQHGSGKKQLADIPYDALHSALSQPKT